MCARFATVRPAVPVAGAGRGSACPSDAGRRSLDRAAFEAGRRRHPRGDRRRRRLPGEPHPPAVARRCPPGADVAALGAALAEGNPAPYSAVVRLPGHGIHVASASPERFLSPRRRPWCARRPIKGTAPAPAELLAKDRAENVMIVDLVRNDLGRVCEWGSVEVPSLLAVEEHPGLVPPRVDGRGPAARRASGGPTRSTPRSRPAR